MPDQKKPIITIALIGIIAIALIGLSGSFSSNSITIPSGHQTVANTVFIVKDGESLTPVCISSGNTPPLSILPLSFTATGSVKNSIWEFRSDKADSTSTYAFLTIWGPDNSGNTYWVEVSRATPSALGVTYQTGSFDFTAGSNIGYIYFESTT